MNPDQLAAEKPADPDLQCFPNWTDPGFALYFYFNP